MNDGPQYIRSCFSVVLRYELEMSFARNISSVQEAWDVSHLHVKAKASCLLDEVFFRTS